MLGVAAKHAGWKGQIRAHPRSRQGRPAGRRAACRGAWAPHCPHHESAAARPGLHGGCKEGGKVRLEVKSRQGRGGRADEKQRGGLSESTTARACMGMHSACGPAARAQRCSSPPVARYPSMSGCHDWHVMLPRWPTVSTGIVPVGAPLKFHTVHLSPPADRAAGGWEGWARS